MDSKFSESILSFGDTDIFNETLETTSPLGGARGGLSEPEDRIGELEREMRLLSWHKVANNAAMKAAIIRTRKLKHNDKKQLHTERLREKAMRMRQIIEEEQHKPLHLDADYVRRYEEKERNKEERLEKEVLRNINTLKRLRGSIAERDDTQKRYSTYRRKRKALERKYQSHGGFSTEKEDMIESHKDNHDPEENESKINVFQSLDKLVQLEKRISVRCLSSVSLSLSRTRPPLHTPLQTGTRNGSDYNDEKTSKRAKNVGLAVPINSWMEKTTSWTNCESTLENCIFHSWSYVETHEKYTC